jgi:hypothetical protein
MEEKMKNKKKQHVTWFLSTLIMILGLNMIFLSQAQAATDPNHTLTFSNKLKVKTLFYPYRDPAGVTGTSAKGLQSITIDSANNFYLTYSTGDKTRYGYIYKYSQKGKLLKKSKQLTVGHGQAISYMDGYLYVIADIQGNTNYTLQKINPATWNVVEKWVIPSSIHPNVLAMQDANTAIAVSKSAGGYDINKIHLGNNIMAERDWREKIHVGGLTGNTLNKPIQGFTIGNGQYYLLLNGEYITFNLDGTNIKHVSLNTDREPEGIAIMEDGKLVIQFNKLNEVFIQQ